MPKFDYVPVATVNVGEFRTEEDPVGTVAFPVRDLINTSTFLAFMGSDRSDLPVDIIIVKGNILTLQRNTLLSRMRGDWILFIDDDMVWQPGAIKSLVQSLHDLEEAGHEVDVLGGLCFRRTEPFQPTLYVRDPISGAYNFLEDWEDQYVEVDGTGMAFALITKRCLERIAQTVMPPYEERVKFAKQPDFFRWSGSLGEDLRFCQDVKAAGGHIVVDTTIVIEHVSETQRGYRDFLREIADREPEVTKIRRKINKRMGLPTLSSAEAKRRLRELAG